MWMDAKLFFYYCAMQNSSPYVIEIIDQRQLANKKGLFMTSIFYAGNQQSKNNILYTGTVYIIMAQPPSSQNKLQGQKLACALNYQNLTDVCQWFSITVQFKFITLLMFS